MTTAAAASQAVVAGAMIASSVASAFSGSPSGGLFQSINFMQLYMLLILLRVYLPKRIEDYILMNDIFNFNLSTSNVSSVPMLNDFLSIFQYAHSDQTLSDLNVESVSTFYNLFAHLLVLLLLVAVHLLMWAGKVN